MGDSCSMKARLNVKRLSAKECEALSRECIDNAFPAVMAAVLYVLYKRGWHKDKLIKLYDDVCDLLAMPPIFGKHLDDREVERFLEDKIGIDWDKIRKVVQIANE